MPTPEFGLEDAAYRSFRPNYPPALFEAILAAVGPHLGLAVDLGAGTGIATAPLCPHFERVIAVEPDAAMASALAGLAGNVEVDPRDAESFSLQAGSADLVNAANCFYWFDGPAVAQRIAQWLRPGAVLAASRYRFPGLTGAANEILKRENRAHWDAFRHDRLRDEEYTKRTLRNCPAFADVSVIQIPCIHYMTPRAVAGFFASSSFASAYARSIGDDTYFDRLADELEAACGGSIESNAPIELVLARTPG